MSRFFNASLAILLVLALLPVGPAQAQAFPKCDVENFQKSGALFCIDQPHIPWNGGLVIFAHGYVSVNEPLAIPWSQMTFVSETGVPVYLPDIINDLGFAFATTSYSVNGLAVQEGIADVHDLIDVFARTVGVPPAFVLLVGASEGGLVTTLALERYPADFDGGLAACGPIGSFTGQINYWGDFRVVFDYFMDSPDFDVLPGNASNIPASLMNKWDSVYVPRIAGVLGFNPLNTLQLFSVTKAPVVPSDPATIGQTTLGILWYNVFATNDAVDKLGGRPFDNFDRVYTGSFNDPLLNAGVKRFKAQPAALAEIANLYETSGNLQVPLVTMHTAGDPIVPYWHQMLYKQKVVANDPDASFIPNEIDRYGHCAFTLEEIQGAFGQLVAMVMYGGATPLMPTTTLQVDKTPVQVEETYYYDYR